LRIRGPLGAAISSQLPIEIYRDLFFVAGSLVGWWQQVLSFFCGLPRFRRTLHKTQRLRQQSQELRILTVSVLYRFLNKIEST
jgi:hypothetical protein